MRVLLINPNQEQMPFPVIPQGLCTVASYLDSANFDVKVLDLCFCKDINRKLKNALVSFDADAICISIRNIDNGEYLATKYYLPQTQYIIKCCREFSKSPIFIGGAAVNLMPKAIKDYTGADFAVSGDIDGPTTCILRQRRKRQPFGLTYRWWDRWINIRDYVWRGAAVGIQAKRGCRFNCIYCSYRNIEGSRIKLKAPRTAVDEIEDIIKSSNIKDFEFVDSVFNEPESHAKDICREIIKRGIKANFGVACLNPLSCSDELFILFRKANFRWLICTPESGSEQMLSNLNKGFTIDAVYNTAGLVKRFKLPTLWAFLAGAPGETMDTVSQTLNFIDRHIDDNDLAYMTVGVRIYPNTLLADIAMKEGLFHDEKQLLKPTFYFSKHLDEQKLKNTLLEFAKTHPNFMCSYETQRPIFNFASRLFYRLGVRPPYWRYAPMFNRLFRN